MLFQNIIIYNFYIKLHMIETYSVHILISIKLGFKLNF